MKLLYYSGWTLSRNFFSGVQWVLHCRKQVERFTSVKWPVRVFDLCDGPAICERRRFHFPEWSSHRIQVSFVAQRPLHDGT